MVRIDADTILIIAGLLLCIDSIFLHVRMGKMRAAIKDIEGHLVAREAERLERGADGIQQ